MILSGYGRRKRGRISEALIYLVASALKLSSVLVFFGTSMLFAVDGPIPLWLKIYFCVLGFVAAVERMSCDERD